MRPNVSRVSTPPIPTPLTANERLDEASLRRLIRHLIKGGVNGAFVLGSTGEFPSLDADTRLEVVRTVMDEAKGRIDIIANASDLSTRKTLRTIEAHAELGVDAVGAIAPYYYPMLDEREIIRYYLDLARHSPVPLLIYNFPTLSKVTMTADVVGRIVGESENVMVIKDSSGEMINFTGLMALSRKYAHFSAFLAAQPLLMTAFVMGADGAITGGANVHPRLYAKLYRAARSRQFAQAERLQAQSDELMKGLRLTRSWTSGFQGIKTALKLMGIFDSKRLCAPFASTTSAQERKIAELLRDMRMLDDE